MAASHSAQKAGERVEELLAELGAQAGPQAAATAEELVASLVEFYGAGLAEIVQIISQDVEAGKRLMTKLAADPLVESLLLSMTCTRCPSRTGSARRSMRSCPSSARTPGRRSRPRTRPAWSTSAWSSATIAARPTPERCRRPSSRVADAAPDAAGVGFEVVTAAPELPLLQIGRSPAARGAQ